MASAADAPNMASTDRTMNISESGVLPFAEEDIVRKWRLQPGKMLLIDPERGELVSDEALKAEIAASKPYGKWVADSQLKISDLPPAMPPMKPNRTTMLDMQQVFGYTQEDLKFLMEPMAETGAEAIGSMGNDTPIPALSSKGKPLYNYFKQLFAQVTNPPIDPIREELVMSLTSFIGPRQRHLRDLSEFARRVPRALSGYHQVHGGQRGVESYSLQHPVSARLDVRTQEQQAPGSQYAGGSRTRDLAHVPSKIAGGDVGEGATGQGAQDHAGRE